MFKSIKNNTFFILSGNIFEMKEDDEAYQLSIYFNDKLGNNHLITVDKNYTTFSQIEKCIYSLNGITKLLDSYLHDELISFFKYCMKDLKKQREDAKKHKIKKDSEVIRELKKDVK